VLCDYGQLCLAYIFIVRWPILPSAGELG
jgi:hypothetical protein